MLNKYIKNFITMLVMLIPTLLVIVLWVLTLGQLKFSLGTTGKANNGKTKV